EERGKFNARYELRNVQFHVGAVRFEPHALGPTGKPVSGNARITKEQAARIVGVLAEADFFRASVGDADRLVVPEGPHAELWAGYGGDARPVRRWRALDWDLHMVRQLEAIRRCVDGEAAKLLDAMLASLEEERREWEKKEVLTVETFEDVDAVW